MNIYFAYKEGVVKFNTNDVGIIWFNLNILNITLTNLLSGFKRSHSNVSVFFYLLPFNLLPFTRVVNFNDYRVEFHWANPLATSDNKEYTIAIIYSVM